MPGDLGDMPAAVYGGPPPALGTIYGGAPAPVPIVAGNVAPSAALPCAQAVTGALLSATRSCYVNALRSDPTLSGTGEVTITVGPAGDVRECSATGLPPAIDSCVGGACTGLSFPCKVMGGGTATVHANIALKTEKP